MDERRFFFNGSIYLTKELTENPLKEAKCLVIILKTRILLIKSDFQPRQCRIVMKSPDLGVWRPNPWSRRVAEQGG